MTEAQSLGAAPEAFRPKRKAFEAEAGDFAASATNRCPKQRFACTDGFRPVVFRIDRIEE